MSAPGTPKSRPEILAPAGDPLALRAAVAAGADAVYLGMARFNARGRAERFRGVTFRSCVKAAQDHGCRVYVTLNTLLHEDELAPALDLAAEARDAGAHAAIVQDPGLAALLRKALPDLPLHGSTQMTIHQGEQAAAAVTLLGLRRIILARECSIHEIRRIAEKIRPLGAGVEVFVHGALCFAYSGQCLMSNFAGRRSANRGICAQNCRFDYSAGAVLKAAACARGAPPRFDGRSSSQLISLKDLAAFESVAALASAGVEAFKIEGRLKGPEYVAEVTRLYRAALDAWEEGRPFQAAEAERAAGRVFSRGFTNGYLLGSIDAGMRGDKRFLEGEPDAWVVSAHRKTGVLHLEPRPGHSIRPGQGYRYTHDRYRGGFRVISVEMPWTSAPRSGTGHPAGSPAAPPATSPVVARVRFGAEATGRRHRRGATGRKRPPPPLPVGLACYLNDDPDVSERIEKLVSSVRIAETGMETIPIKLALSGRPGAPLLARAESADGRAAEARTRENLEPARSRSLTVEILREHLGRLGGTSFRLESLDASALESGAFLGFPSLHALRRDLVKSLESMARGPRREAPAGALSGSRSERRRRTTLTVCVGSPAALEAALIAGAARVIVEDQELPADHPGWEVRWAGALHSVEAPWFRLPPIVHDETRDLAAIERIRSVARASGAGVVGVLAGHLGQVRMCKAAGIPVAADHYLNTYNHLAAGVLEEAGAQRATLSLEVDAGEAVQAAGRAAEAVEIEVVVGGQVPSMLTRQDYSLGQDEAFLAVSEHGHAYLFRRSPSGATALYEARELVGAEALRTLAGRVDAVRLDLAHQEPIAVAEIVGAYKAALDELSSSSQGDDASAHFSEASAASAARARDVHAAHAPHGHFTGHLIRGARHQE
jgi:putative protease